MKMKLEDAMAAGGLFLLCGTISFTWELFICMGAGMITNATLSSTAPESIPLFFDLWMVPLLLITAFHLLFPMERYVKIGTIAGFCLPPLVVLMPLLRIFYG